MAKPNLSGLFPDAGPPLGPPSDWGDFRALLPNLVDTGKLDKAWKMLRAERFQLFAEALPDHVVGLVRSQSTASRIYACRLADDGSYTCATQNMITCVTSKDSPCKHLLVLVIGLVRSGALDPSAAYARLLAARSRSGPRRDERIDSEIVSTFLRYKGVEAGEIDWRPTETIPEDFYAY